MRTVDPDILDILLHNAIKGIPDTNAIIQLQTGRALYFNGHNAFGRVRFLVYGSLLVFNTPFPRRRGEWGVMNSTLDMEKCLVHSYIHPKIRSIS